MNELIQLLISTLFMFVFHEFIHYLSLIFIGVKFKSLYISKKGVGFVVDNNYMKSNKKLSFFFLSPLLLSFVFLFNYNSRFLIFFSILNLLWSLSDLGMVFKLRKKSPEQRVKWADRWDKESLEKSFLVLPLNY